MPPLGTRDDENGAPLPTSIFRIGHSRGPLCKSAARIPRRGGVLRGWRRPEGDREANAGAWAPLRADPIWAFEGGGMRLRRAPGGPHLAGGPALTVGQLRRRAWDVAWAPLGQVGRNSWNPA
jgi:hypothetical protein